MRALSYPCRSLRRVRTVVSLAARPDFTVASVTCRDDHTGWSEAEVHDDYRVVLVRSGRFRRWASGVPADVDRTLAYVGMPGEEENFAHPAGGDVCTSVQLTPRLWQQLAGDDMRVARPVLYVDAGLELAHRRLHAAARAGDIDYALTEELLGLLKPALRQVVARPTPVSAQVNRGTSGLVAAARDAIISGDPASDGLISLAEQLGVSPYRLSRAFSRELGVSVTRYRNRVRVGHALDRLAEGEPSAAALAADLGFADQAHMSRTVRQHLGCTPTALRRLLDPR